MRIISLSFLILLIPSLVFSQKSKFDREDLDKLPEPPDYSQLFFWAAHPIKDDYADLLPGDIGLKNLQDEADVDVFFVHPTIYTGKQSSEYPWNADLRDTVLNDKVDHSTIKNQASLFNGIAKIYAPRYRQGHLEIFYTNDTLIKRTALENAYEDVKTAFQYYLDNWNHGRPIIIASHSQGTLHAVRLIQDFFDSKPLSSSLIAAYLVGMPLKASSFESVKPCQSESETECWVSWNTYKKGYYPDRYTITYRDVISTNPLNWKIDDTYAPRNQNIGGVLRNYEKIYPEVTDAQNYNGILWSEKPHFPGRIFLFTKRYHIADYNLFYLNIRENAELRSNTFLSN